VYLKILPHGVGSVAQALEYNFDDTNHAGIERKTEPRLLSGNPQALQRVCDSSPHRWKYTSGVLSFSEQLTERQKFEIIDSFEKHHFPGLSKEQYELCWVEHDDHTRTELNFVIARIDLKSGKHLNAFPPGWQSHSDPWQTAINLQYGFSRPDIPVNLAAEICEQYHPDKASRNDVIKTVTNYVSQRFGDIKSRDDVALVVGELNDLGIKVESESTKYISISAEGFEKNIRLKGAIYDRQSYDGGGFKFSREREDTHTYRGSEQEYRDVCSAADAAAERRGSENRKRFKTDSANPDSIFRTEAISEILHRKAQATSNREQDARAGQEAVANGNPQTNKASALVVGRRGGADSAADRSTVMDLGATSLVTQGHENETALQYAKRKQAEFDFYRRKQEKEAANARQEQQQLEKIRNEIERHLKQLTAHIFSYARIIIPGISRLVRNNNRANDTYREQTRTDASANRRAFGNIASAQLITEEAHNRISELQQRSVSDIRRASRDFMIRYLERRSLDDENVPELTPK